MSQKEEKALRVFEALNGVDEELLLRSEKNAEKKLLTLSIISPPP